jgi:single-strand DNA-binding protein
MAVRDLNQVMLIGNVGEDPKLTTTSKGSSVCTFFIATNRTWSPSNTDEVKEATEWHSIVAFSKLAEICAAILQKGTRVFIEGRIQTREFDGKNGEKVQKREVVASSVIGFDKRKNLN